MIDIFFKIRYSKVKGHAMIYFCVKIENNNSTLCILTEGRRDDGRISTISTVGVYY